MQVKLWNKTKQEYEAIDNIDSVYLNDFRNTIELTCCGKKMSYGNKEYFLVSVSKQ